MPKKCQNKVKPKGMKLSFCIPRSTNLLWLSQSCRFGWLHYDYHMPGGWGEWKIVHNRKMRKSQNGTNDRYNGWKFIDLWKYEARPGAREELTSPDRLDGPRRSKHIVKLSAHLVWTDTIYGKDHSHNTHLTETKKLNFNRNTISQNPFFVKS